MVPPSTSTSTVCCPRLALQGFVDRYADDRHDQAIAEIIHLPRRVNRRYPADDYPLGAAGPGLERHGPFLCCRGPGNRKEGEGRHEIAHAHPSIKLN